MSVLSTRIVDTLIGMRHGRIRYQWQDQKKGDKALPAAGVATEEDVAAARREIDEREEREEAARKQPPEER